jgi:hypothetical protein
MNHLNLKSPLKQAHMKPDKPEDREESWLRKMADRLPRRRSPAVVKEESEEEDEPESDGPANRSPRKPKKKPKKDDGCTWPVFIFFALAAYGAWKILVAVFG